MERRTADLLDGKARVVQGRVDQTDVHIPSPERVFLFGSGHFAHHKADVGQPCVEVCGDLGVEDEQRGRGDAETQLPDLAPVGALGKRRGIVHVTKHLAGLVRNTSPARVSATMRLFRCASRTSVPVPAA